MYNYDHLKECHAIHSYECVGTLLVYAIQQEWPEYTKPFMANAKQLFIAVSENAKDVSYKHSFLLSLNCRNLLNG